MKTENEIKRRLTTLKALQFSGFANDERVDAGIKTLEWVLQ